MLVAGEMAPQLRALVALALDWGSNPRIHIAANNHHPNSGSKGSDTLF